MRRRRSVWLAVAVAGGAAFLLSGRPAGADALTTFTTPGCTPWDVPVGVSSVTISAWGAAGESPAGGGAGGAGAALVETAPVTHGQILYACVAVGAGAAGSGVNPGGRGGGASGVSIGAGLAAPLLIAAGGGGGGGGIGAGAGGATGASGSGSTPGRPGTGTHGGSAGGKGTAGAAGQGGTGETGLVSGGGGGGGGLFGGGGGGGGVIASGGGGGSSYCSTTCSSGAPGPAEVVISYTVATPPLLRVVRPESGAVYVRGQRVKSLFACGEGAGGPGIASCVDQHGGRTGAFVDTSSLGRHVLTVKATSANGEVATAIARYTVVRAATLSKLSTRHGVITFTVTVPTGGAVAAVATTNFKRSALFGESNVVATGSGKVPMIVIPSRAGKLLLRRHRHVALHLFVRYTATNGLPQLVAKPFLSIAR